MKRTLKCILCFTVALIFLMIGVNASAVSADAEYLITQSDGAYTLSKYQNGVPEKLSEQAALSPLLALCKGGSVTLDGITVNEAIEIDKADIIMSGTITLKDKLVISKDAAVTFNNLKLDTASHIRIKGGKLTIIESELSAPSEVVVMDYSSLSSLNVLSGKITSSGISPTLSLISGTAVISGGEIMSSGGAAIESSSTLTLSGAPLISGISYDIITASPISLSRTSVPYSGELSLMWHGIFSEGDMYEIFRDTTPASLEKITLCDKVGKEYKTTYLESSSHTDDLNIGAVYLPYEYVYYDGTEKLFSEFYLKGEVPKQPEAPEKCGYSFAGWYSDEEKSNDFPFADRVSGNTEIFASYKLSSPAFSLSSLSFTYDGEQRLLTFDTLTHPLNQEGFYTLEWYKDGEYIGSFESVGVKNTSDGGRYYCKITFRHSKDSVSVTTPEVSVTVAKRAVALPKPQAKPYSGKLQYSDIHSNALYTVTDNGAIDAGDYNIILTLKDPENYIFEDGLEKSTDVIFTVTKCQNTWTSTPDIKNFYQNSIAEHSAHSAFGNVYFLYSSSKEGTYTENLPTLAGEYFCIAKVDQTDNYYELLSEPIPFSILAEIPLGITVNTPPEKTHYLAFEKLSVIGLSINVIYNSGRAETVGADALGIKYQSGNTFLYGDNAVILSYLSLEVSLPVTVSRRTYDISEIGFADKEVIYNGKYQTLNMTGVLPTGLDGIPLMAEISSGGVNAGEYTMTLSFKTESRNYILPDNKTAILKILPFSADVIWGNTVFVYDGAPKCPTAHIVSTEGIKIPLAVSGAQVGAKDGISATATPPNENYTLKNPNELFKILKADISFSGVSWSASTFPYNNENRTVTVMGLPAGVVVVGYTDNTAKNAGVYTATAILSYDEQNYNAPAPLKHTWTITRLDYDLSGFKFSDASFVYDGNVHYPTLTGALPVGLDGIPLTYFFSAGYKDVTEGERSVCITFSTESENYNCPSEMYARLKIIPMPIKVEWSYSSAVYDGLPHIPTAASPYTQINVSGGAVDAGTYTALAKSASKNYSIINSEYIFEISKAENVWLKLPTVKDIFASGTPSPEAKAKDGEPIFKYYKDIACTEQVSVPFTSGIYYMCASVEEGKNYLPLSAEPVSFEVIAVIPESLSVLLKNDNLVAFYSLKDTDIEARLKYNDGTESSLLLSELEVVYQNQDSLRAGDTQIKISFKSLSVLLDVTVGKAKYDTSSVVWQNTEHIYNGEYKIPTVSGLPYGVSVLEYTGYGKDAGTYSVNARLSYDEANYYAPVIPAATVIIEKCRLDTPVIPNIEYNGNLNRPSLDKELYKTDFAGALNAGKYPVTVTLLDTNNYTFDGGAISAVSELTVTPKPIALSIPEITLYLWQSPRLPEVELLSELIGGDEVGFDFDILGDTMVIKSLNPNYTIENGEAKINLINRPSPNVISGIIISLAFLALVLLAVTAGYLNREKIKDIIAARKCKQSFIREAEIKKIDEIVKSEELLDTPVFSVNVERADSLISDNLAKNLIKKEHDVVYTDGKRKCVINIDTVSDNFLSGELVDINSLKERGLIPADSGNVKILARGSIDKPLTVKANAFSLSAVKMIALSGGVAIKVVTQKNGN